MFYVIGKCVDAAGTTLVSVPFARNFTSKSEAEYFIKRVVPSVLPFLPKIICENKRLVFEVCNELPSTTEAR